MRSVEDRGVRSDFESRMDIIDLFEARVEQESDVTRILVIDLDETERTEWVRAGLGG